MNRLDDQGVSLTRFGFRVPLWIDRAACHKVPDTRFEACRIRRLWSQRTSGRAPNRAAGAARFGQCVSSCCTYPMLGSWTKRHRKSGLIHSGGVGVVSRQASPGAGMHGRCVRCPLDRMHGMFGSTYPEERMVRSNAVRLAQRRSVGRERSSQACECLAARLPVGRFG
jgi:hypothetical protein